MNERPKRFPQVAARLRRRLGLGLCATLAASCTALPAIAPPPAALARQVDLYGREVARLRGLEIREPVPADVQTPDTLRARMTDLLEEEWTAEDVLAERAYKAFGLIPREMDLKAYLVDLFGGQVAGYYDPKQKAFFVIDGKGAQAQQEGLGGAFVIAHEFVHALQDQHFDLEGTDARTRGRPDQSMALQALVEGDAMLGALDHLAWRSGFPLSAVSPLGRAVTRVVALSANQAPDGQGAQAEQLATAPPVLRRSLIFPYTDGMAFASALRTDFGQAGIDAAFEDLPESTEQILHPERYIDRRDRPVRITLAPPPAGFAWAEGTRDAGSPDGGDPAAPEPPATGVGASQGLGMIDVQVLLEQGIGSGRAAEGWDGDAYAIWQSDAREEVLVWLSVWDHPFEARRFARAYRRLLEQKRDDGHFSVVVEGDRVAAIEGPDAESCAALSRHLLTSQVERAPDDRTPPSLIERIARWPLSLSKLDRGRELSVLGGQVALWRIHDGGHRLSLADGWILTSEHSPDRRTLATAGGLVWWSRDRYHDFSAASIPVLLATQRRGQGAAMRRSVRVGQTVLLPDALRYDQEGGLNMLRVFGALRVQWGSVVPRGRHLLLFGLPVPWI